MISKKKKGLHFDFSCKFAIFLPKIIVISKKKEKGLYPESILYFFLQGVGAPTLENTAARSPIKGFQSSFMFCFLSPPCSLTAP